MTHDDLSFSPDTACAMRYFRTRSDYAPTPLRQLVLPGGHPLWVKDETGRMGLGAFKALGGPYAISRLVTQAWATATGGDGADDHAYMTEGVRQFAAGQTFVTASAGNHGMGVAAGARFHGAQARIYLSETVPQGFDARLKALGADVVRAGKDYEASVEAAIEDSARTGAILLADGTWPGYTEIPKLVMEGYTVMAEEIRAEFEASNTWPTDVFLQAGVGGMAAAMALMIRRNWQGTPRIHVVEPDAATCLQDSHKAGRITRATGPESAMGRLDCKDASIVAWQVLEACDVRYLAVSEEEGAEAAQEMTALGVATTPSGAAGFAGLQQLKRHGPGLVGTRPLVLVTESRAN